MTVEQVTVFGGSGFLGRHVVRALARAGYRIRVAVRSPHSANFLRPMGHVGQIDLVRANVRAEDDVRRALEGADAAINLVGILTQSGPQKFADIHVNAARTVARLAKEAGAESLVHVSAIGANPDSRSRYARTKAEGEAAVRKAFPEAVIVRPSIIIGPEDQFFNRFAALARFSPVVPVIGGGRTRFQPVFVGDVAEAIVKAVADPSTHGRTYELGGPAVYTFRELMEYMLATVRRRRPLVSVPFPLAKLKAVFLGLLPKPLLTLDQVRLLRYDNVVADESAGTFRDLGIEPRALDVVVPSYLERFRPRGQFQQRDLA